MVNLESTEPDETSQLGTITPVHKVHDTQSLDDQSDSDNEQPKDKLELIRSNRRPKKREILVSYAEWIGKEANEQYHNDNIFLSTLDTHSENLLST